MIIFISLISVFLSLFMSMRINSYAQKKIKREKNKIIFLHIINLTKLIILSVKKMNYQSSGCFSNNFLR